MKILLFIMGLFSLMDYKPEPVISEVGLGNNEYLLIEGCSIISSNVDWNKEGNYTVNYYHNTLKKELSREVYVIGSDYQEIGFFENIFIHDYPYEVKEMVVDEEGYYFCGIVPSNDGFQWTTLPQSYGYIAYFQEDKLIWEISFIDDYSYVSSIVIIDNCLYALLTIENGTGSSLKLLEINSGVITRQLELAKDRKSFGDQMIVINNRLFIHCESTSRSGYLSYIEQSEYIGILEIDINRLEVINSHCFGNIGKNMIVSLDYDDETICLVILMDGLGGPFKDLYGTYTGSFLVVFDLSLKMIEYRYITYLTIRDFFITPYDYVVIVGGQDGIRAWIDVVIMFRSINYEQVHRWYTPGIDLFIYDLIHTRSEDGCNFLGINIYNRILKRKEFIGVIEFTNIYSLKEITYYPTSQNSFFIDDIYSSNGLLILAGREQGKVRIDSFLGIRAQKTRHFIYDNQNYYYKYIYLNGKNLGVLGNKENPIFGHHQDLFYVDDYAKVLLENRYYIPSLINIKNNQTYDCEISLEFNGYGFLNGKEISNHFIIDNVGDYSLVVHGSGGVREIINFKVDYISLTDKISEVNEFTLDEGGLITTPFQKKRISFENYITNDNNQYGIIFLVLLIISFIIIALFKRVKLGKKK